MTDIPALTKQLEAGLGCSATAPIWTAEDRRALLSQVAAQNKADTALDPRVPVLTITDNNGALEIDRTVNGVKRPVLKLGSTQQGAVCDGGTIDAQFSTLKVGDPT